MTHLNANQLGVIDGIECRLRSIFEGKKDIKIAVERGDNAIASEAKYDIPANYLEGDSAAFFRLYVSLPVTIEYTVDGTNTRLKHPETISTKRPFVWDARRTGANIKRLYVTPTTATDTTVQFVVVNVPIRLAEDVFGIFTKRLIFRRSEDQGAIVAGADGTAFNIVIEKDTINNYRLRNVGMVLNEDTDILLKFYSADTTQGTSELTNLFVGSQELTDPLDDSDEFVRALDVDIAMVDSDGTGELHVVPKNTGGTDTTIAYFTFIFEEES